MSNPNSENPLVQASSSNSFSVPSPLSSASDQTPTPSPMETSVEQSSPHPASVSTIPSTIQQIIHKDLPISFPEKFNGDRTKYRGFINQLTLIFLTYPERFPHGSTKVTAAATLFTGSALEWFNPFIEQPEVYRNFLTDWTLFRQELDKAFTDFDRATSVTTKLRSLQQGNFHVSQYAHAKKYTSI